MTAPQPPTDEDIDAVADRFEADWKAGRRPSIEHYLRDYGDGDRAVLARELVCLDVIYRRMAGESADLSEYLPRFPELSRLPTGELSRLRQSIDRSAPPPRATPNRIGKYQVLDRLAEGGQAVAYRAYHPGLQQPVVLKHAKTAADPDLRDRLAREGSVLAELRHPNLVRVYDLEVADGRVVLVLENVPGRPLDEYAAAERPTPRQAAAIVAAAARGLGAAHRHGVSHLDVSPRNVLIQPDGTPTVIDFGLARHAGWQSSDDPAALGGTLGYLSPEQAAGRADQLGPRTDVFGLGGVLYHLLTGRPLYPWEGAAATLEKARARRIDEAPLFAPAVPRRLREVGLKALAADPADRYANGEALAEALEAFLAPPRWRGLLRYAGFFAGLFLLALLGGWVAGRLRQPPDLPASPPATALQVEVWREESAYRPLVQALPVRSGEEVRVRVRVPGGTHVALYLVNGRGALARLSHYPAADADREEVYPAPGKTSVLEGPAGTEFVLACGRTDGPVRDEDIHRLWDASGGAWPGLSERVAVRVTTDGVEWDGERPRDLGATRDRPEPAELVRRRLEEFRLRLRAAGVTSCEGIAFGHK
jgi:tRNA A-37 threonylcarbamoyl transferase component Bud32